MRENLKRRLDTIQKNIWLTFLGVVAALAIALSVFYFFKMRDMRLKRVANDDVYKQQLENHYQMSLFRLCDSTKTRTPIFPSWRYQIRPPCSRSCCSKFRAKRTPR